jgi:hypothetical protein
MSVPTKSATRRTELTVRLVIDYGPFHSGMTTPKRLQAQDENRTISICVREVL